MAVVQPATAEMFEAIYPLLVALNPALPKEKWRTLVDYPWRAPGDELGYVLVDKGEIVGFLSTLYSRRVIDGVETRFCNTAHWVVRQEFRADSMRLFLTVLRQRDTTITNLTSSVAVAAMMPKLGFKLLEERVQLLIPHPIAPRLPTSRSPRIVSERAAIATMLDSDDRKIFDDHAGSECGHLAVRDGDDYCYMVFIRKHRRLLGIDVPYCHIHYVSNRALFVRHIARIKWHFLTRAGALLVAVDDRLAGKRLGAFSRIHTLGIPRYYRGDGVAADQIDNLYTELVLGL